ncbi:MAG: transcription antitermination factor NusB [Acidobacteria bacterium]|nr:transcription antitermination factor NusB [Acidobacteriota bacterium]
MPSRRRSRERALQVLYQWDIRRNPVDEAIRSFYDTLYSEASGETTPPPRPDPDPFMESLARGAAEAGAATDEQIEKYSQHWRLERMSTVDRNILRLAIYEMKTVGTAPAIAIDEALELARRFSGDQSVSFINGILDAVRKQGGA